MKLAISLNFKKITKKVLLALLPVALVGTGAIIYSSYEPKKTIPDDVDVVGNRSRQVYTIAKDNLVVPLTINYQQDTEDVLQEVGYLSNLMLKGSTLSRGDYQGVLPRGTILKDKTLVDGVLTLNYNQAFNDYEVSKEYRIVEAVAWTFTQFPEVDEVVLQVEDERLMRMPLSSTPLPNKLNRNIGINNHLLNFGTSNLDTVNIYYEKELNNAKKYVPVSINIDTSSPTDQIISGLTKSIPLSTPIKKASVLANHQIIELTQIDDQIDLSLGVSSLIDEVTVDNKIFDFVVMNLLINDIEVTNVNVLIDGEAKSVNGYQDTASAISGIIYNQIKI